MSRPGCLKPEWPRVIGPDLDKDNKVLFKANRDTMNDPIFIAACERAKIDATKRQASKWNNGKGLARKNK